MSGKPKLQPYDRNQFAKSGSALVGLKLNILQAFFPPNKQHHCPAVVEALIAGLQ